MQTFEETILGQKVTVEVGEEAGWNTRYNGYGWCPMKECEDREAFQRSAQGSVNSARSAARKAVDDHLRRVHKLK